MTFDLAILDPQAKAVLDELAAKATPMPPDESEWLAGYRGELDAVVAMQGPSPQVAVKDVTSVGVALRLYNAIDGRPQPTLLFIHGGGFVGGSLEGYDIPLRHLASRSGWQVAAVDYRLAPEHPYPAAPDDCLAALRALHDDLSLGADASRLAVGGDSAGGLLASVTAMGARDAGFTLLLQVLLYPNTDLRPGLHHASRGTYDGAVIRIDELYRSLDLYCGAADRTEAHVSPLLTADLAGLCSALVVTSEVDPLRDEGEAYAARLREAGIAVEAVRLPGMIHSCLQRGARLAAGDALITRVAERLRAVTA